MLKAVDRTITPWLFVTIHTPLYNPFDWHTQDYQMLLSRKVLEPLLVNYQVNVVFSGHLHAYMRTHPVIDGVRDKKGPIYICTGTGGHAADLDFASEIPEEWVSVRDSTFYGYGTIDIFNQTHARWQWMHSCIKDDRQFNGVHHMNISLPSADEEDVYIQNQYYI